MISLILQVFLILLYILLALLGLIAFVILAFLFIPFGYNIYSEKVSEEISAKAKLRWFIFSFLYMHEDGKDIIKVRILGIPIPSIKKKKNKDKPVEIPKEEPSDDSNEKPEKELKEKPKKEPKEEPKEAKKTSIEKQLQQALDQYNMVVKYPDKKVIIKSAINLFKTLLKKLKPKIFKVDMEVGLDDPSATGFIMAATSLLIELHPHVNIYGNFEEKTFTYKARIKGRLFLFPFMYHTCKFVLQKPIRTLIRKILF